MTGKVDVLRYVADRGPVTAIDVARRFRLGQDAALKHLERLSAAGHVRFIPHAGLSKPFWRVAMTDRGSRRLAFDAAAGDGVVGEDLFS